MKLMALVAVIALTVAACGDDDDASGSDADLSITARSFSYTPDAWTVEGNTDVSVMLTNDSESDEHEWAVLVEGVTINSEAEFNEEIVFGEIEPVQPGESTTQTFNFPPGTYQIICALEGHFDAGMTGTLTVTG